MQPFFLLTYLFAAVYCANTTVNYLRTANMQETRVHYETTDGLAGSVTVLLGDTYLSADSFVEDFDLIIPVGW